MEQLLEFESQSRELLDEELGLKYCADDEEIYTDTLELFCGIAEENSRQIQKLHDENDWKSYCVKVHSLKSTSLTLGARALSVCAKQLELASRRKYEGGSRDGDEDLLSQGHNELLSLYRDTVSEMKRYLDGRVSP